MKNSKAISPIFATLILIAIAVIAGVVVYMFTSGTLATMTGNTGNTAQEKVTVQGAALSAGSGATVYAQSTNGLAVTVNNVIVKDASGNTIASGSVTATLGALDAKGTLATIGPIGLVVTTGQTITAGSSYTITVSTTKGGSFVSSQVIATA